MARKSIEFAIDIHYPEGWSRASYQEVFDRFRMEQIEKYIAQYPPKVQLALLDELEQRLLADNT